VELKHVLILLFDASLVQRGHIRGLSPVYRSEADKSIFSLISFSKRRFKNGLEMSFLKWI